MNLEPCADSDIPDVVTLMNRAYRGGGAERGWATEAGYIVGDRTSETLLRADLAADPDAVLLLWRAEADLAGCVWLQPLDPRTWYLGSLTIDPRLQNAGAGRSLLAAAEDWVRQRGATTVRMTVVNVRDTLIAWYVRRGYHLTGETEPFPYDDARFGVPQRDDLHFVVLAKTIAAAS